MGLVAVGAFVVLGRIAPVYKSQAAILIETGESDLTRTTQSGGGQTGPVLDQEAIASQVQLIRSREVAETVADKLDLAARAEFDGALAEPSAVAAFLARLGLASRPSDSSVNERVLKAYYDNLSVYALDKSRVIGIDFSSTDPRLAADAANAIAEGYIALQREVKRDTTTDAAAFLSTQIVDLRAKVMDSEAKVETVRAENDLFSGGGQTPTMLPEQQLADLNTELSRARAERVDAEAKATEISVGLKGGTALNLTDVLNSQLIQRLVEQQVALKSQIAQMSATLLPQHPRMKGLNAQLADLNRQIAGEASKILESLEGEAKLARAREDEIARGLGQLKAVAARANNAGVQLHAVEREAAARRDLLDSYLRRYREALAREQTDYQPVDARIISRAAVAIEPDFPKKIPMTAATAVAALILAVAFVLLRELASGRPMRQVSFAAPPAAVQDAPAIPDDGNRRWADDDVRRMMPSQPEPTLAPALLGRAEESLAAVAGEIIDSGAKRVLATLAEGCEANGRPLVAVALARALARTGARVVVIDFRGDDANSVSMGESPDLPGFADLFDGQASFAQVIFRDRRSRVHFIPAGHQLLPPEMLPDERLETILSALTLTYDYVILDARNEMIATLGPSCPVAIVVSEFGAADPRTAAAFEHIKAVVEANIRLLVVDSAPVEDGDEFGETIERAKERDKDLTKDRTEDRAAAPAGEAA